MQTTTEGISCALSLHHISKVAFTLTSLRSKLGLIRPVVWPSGVAEEAVTLILSGLPEILALMSVINHYHFKCPSLRIGDLYLGHQHVLRPRRC